MPLCKVFIPDESGKTIPSAHIHEAIVRHFKALPENAQVIIIKVNNNNVFPKAVVFDVRGKAVSGREKKGAMDGFRNEMAKLTAEHFPDALFKCRVELFSPALLCEYESPIHTTTPIQSKL